MRQQIVLLNVKIKILYQLVKYFAREKIHEISHLPEIIRRNPVGVKHIYLALCLLIGVLPQTSESVSAVSYYGLLLLHTLLRFKITLLRMIYILSSGLYL